MGIVVSNGPVMEMPCPGYVGVLPGRESQPAEDIYAKVLNLTGGPVQMTALAIPGGGKKVITVANSNIGEISASKDLGAKGAQWVDVHVDKPCWIAFDVR